jgi:hypothetical protein
MRKRDEFWGSTKIPTTTNELKKFVTFGVERTPKLIFHGYRLVAMAFGLGPNITWVRVPLPVIFARIAQPELRALVYETRYGDSSSPAGTNFLPV